METCLFLLDHKIIQSFISKGIGMIFVTLLLKFGKNIILSCNVQYCSAFLNFTILCCRVYCLKQVITGSKLKDGNQLIAFSLFIMVKFNSVLEQFFETNCVWELRYHCIKIHFTMESYKMLDLLMKLFQH